MKEKIYVVGDLHGCYKEYKMITDYLDEVALWKPEERIKLIINGDIIDRGSMSIPIIFDILKRQKNHKGFIDIEVLAGNHELMMYEALVQRVNNKWTNTTKTSWFIPSNGALMTAFQYGELDEKNKNLVNEFIRNLELQRSYEKPIVDSKGVIVVHSQASETIKKINDVLGKRPKLKDIEKDIKDSYRIGCITTAKYYHYYKTLWTRPEESKNLGLDGYITIIGHTPVDNEDGYSYDENNKVLNIDGDCASLGRKYKKETIIPLVELDYENDQLKIHRFSSNNQKLKTHYITSNGIEKEQIKIKKVK